MSCYLVSHRDYGWRGRRTQHTPAMRKPVRMRGMNLRTFFTFLNHINHEGAEFRMVLLSQSEVRIGWEGPMGRWGASQRAERCYLCQGKKITEVVWHRANTDSFNSRVGSGGGSRATMNTIDQYLNFEKRESKDFCYLSSEHLMIYLMMFWVIVFFQCFAFNGNPWERHLHLGVLN